MLLKILCVLVLICYCLPDQESEKYKYGQPPPEEYQPPKEEYEPPREEYQPPREEYKSPNGESKPASQNEDEMRDRIINTKIDKIDETLQKVDNLMKETRMDGPKGEEEPKPSESPLPTVPIPSTHDKVAAPEAQDDVAAPESQDVTAPEASQDNSDEVSQMVKEHFKKLESFPTKPADTRRMFEHPLAKDVKKISDVSLEIKFRRAHGLPTKPA